MIIENLMTPNYRFVVNRLDVRQTLTRDLGFILSDHNSLRISPTVDKRTEINRGAGQLGRTPDLKIGGRKGEPFAIIMST
jgi:hypothetical protein